MVRLAGKNGVRIHPATFRRTLIAWGKRHFRHLPWRSRRYAYDILMAEIMLHRTQAKQVVPVYEGFIRQYPSPKELAAARRKDLRKTLYSLGLRWRIDLIASMARRLRKEFGGTVPKEKTLLLSLPGISDYIASAVRCFAFNMPDPLVDTNTVRVIGRVFGFDVRDSSRRNRRFRELIRALVDPEQPRVYNYALLDLASEVCHKGTRPECHRCPVVRWCMFARTNV